MPNNWSRRAFLPVIPSLPAALTRASDRNPVIGILLNLRENDTLFEAPVRRLLDELRRIGITHGQTFDLRIHWSNGSTADLLQRAKELVDQRPTVILSTTGLIVKELKRLTRDIPVIFVFVGDPVGQGIVESYNRPGSNITGLAINDTTLGGKWISLLRSINPAPSHIHYIYNPNTIPYGKSYFDALQHNRAPDISLTHHEVDSKDQMMRTVESIGSMSGVGVIALPDPFISAYRSALTDVLRDRRVPAIFGYDFMAAEGALMAYGIDVTEHLVGAADYLKKVLYEKRLPADLPIQGPRRFRLVLNKIEASKLGVEFTPLLLALADGVIE